MTTPEPSRDLLRKVKAHFILEGTTLTAWCRDNGINMPNAREALMGTWDGPAGRRLRERLCHVAGLMSSRRAA
jgi:hypothetical protein